MTCQLVIVCVRDHMIFFQNLHEKIIGKILFKHGIQIQCHFIAVMYVTESKFSMQLPQYIFS